MPCLRRQPCQSAIGCRERVGQRFRDVRGLFAAPQREVRRPIERNRIGIEQVGHDVRIRADRGVEHLARSRRAAVDTQLLQQTAVRPQGLQVALVLGEQGTDFVIQTAFQQSG